MGKLSKAEAQVYDRQLRVWGVEVQKRLQEARVLILGCNSLAAEVAKNIVLAGVGVVTLVDDTPCLEGAPGNFLVPTDADATRSVASVSTETLQEMNPFVKVECREGGVEEVCNELGKFDIVVLMGGTVSEQIELNKKCRAAEVKFLAGCVRGVQGYFFLDLQSHAYNTKSDGNAAGPSSHSLEYVPLESAMAVPVSHLQKKTHGIYFALQVCAQFERQHQRSPGPNDWNTLLGIAQTLSAGAPFNGLSMNDQMLRHFTSGVGELPPVCAVLGGIVANEIVKIVGGNSEPLRNFFFYSMMDGKGVAERLGV